MITSGVYLDYNLINKFCTAMFVPWARDQTLAVGYFLS